LEAVAVFLLVSSNAGMMFFLVAARRMRSLSVSFNLRVSLLVELVVTVVSELQLELELY